MSEKGIAFFITLFLSKEYGYIFLKKLTGFKQGDKAKYRFTLETFTTLSTRPPAEKLKQETDNKLALSLDLLNELSKVPIELFETLSPLDQKRYRDIKDESELGDDDEFYRARIRHRNRFEYFALRYLDELTDFKNIGFYTYLGNYHHKMYEKEVIDGKKEERHLNFQLAGFCKNIDTNLTERLKEKTNITIQKIEEHQRVSLVEFKPYIEEANPHYIINNNNIGIKILTNSTDQFPIFSDKGVKMPSADFWLSKYELPAMVFYSYLRTIYPYLCPKSVVEILKESVAEHTYSSAKNSEEKKVLINRHIQKKIFWTESKLKELETIEKNDNSAFGKKRHKTLRSGSIAKILAQDIMKLQPSLNNGKDKITSANFQALQRSIAYYNINKHALYDIFKKASLLESSNPHPFLNKLLSYNKTINHSSLQQFYKNYLLCRKEYFKEQLKSDNNNCYSLRKTGKSSASTDLASLPIFLSRGVFSNAIKDALSKTKIGCETKKEQANCTYLIKKYFQEIENKETQPFYKEKRGYRIKDKQKEEKSHHKVIPKKYMTLDERKQWLSNLKPYKIEISKSNNILEKGERLYRKSYNEICDNEAYLRFTETQDILLFLISKALLPPDLTNNINYNLKNIDKLLCTKTNFSVNINIGKKIVANGIKIKDFGKVHALKRDTKLITLFNILPKDMSEINYSDYLKEQQEYENTRVSIIKNAQTFEQEIVNRYPNIEKREEGYYNFGELIKTLKEKHPYLEPNIGSNITTIRNKFSHNEYPSIDTPFTPNKTASDSIYIAKKMGDYFETEIYKLKQLLTT